MTDVPVTYRLRPALGVRVLGMACLWLVLVVVLEVVRQSVPALDVAAVVAVEWVLGAVVVVAAAWGGAVLAGRGPGLALDAEGFRNRTTWRRDSVRSARWTDVADVRRGDTGSSTGVLVVELADGRRSVIASGLLDVSAATLEERLRDRLNHAHGYRPL